MLGDPVLWGLFFGEHGLTQQLVGSVNIIVQALSTSEQFTRCS